MREFFKGLTWTANGMLIWGAALTALSVAATWVAHQIDLLGKLNWADSVFIGVFSVVLVFLLISVALALYRYFNPLPYKRPQEQKAEKEWPDPDGASGNRKIQLSSENREVMKKIEARVSSLETAIDGKNFLSDDAASQKFSILQKTISDKINEIRGEISNFESAMEIRKFLNYFILLERSRYAEGLVKYTDHALEDLNKNGPRHLGGMGGLLNRYWEMWPLIGCSAEDIKKQISRIEAEIKGDAKFLQDGEAARQTLILTKQIDYLRRLAEDASRPPSLEIFLKEMQKHGV